MQVFIKTSICLKNTYEEIFLERGNKTDDRNISELLYE